MTNVAPDHSIRTGSVLLSVYNEALLGYLYDPAHEAEIAKLLDAAGTTFSDAPGATKDRALKELASKALLVAWELYQDDPLHVEIAIGEPPTSKEKRAVPMLKPLTALLRVSSGRVALHSPTTAPWSDPLEGEEPAFFDVPPGDYVVNVTHLDLGDLARRHGEDFEWQGGHQFITLTPVADHKPVKKSWPYLPYPDEGARAKRRFKIDGDTFHGEVLSGSMFGVSPVRTNLTPAHATAIGLAFGQIRPLGIGKSAHHLLMTGVSDLDQARAVFGSAYAELAEKYPSLYGGCWIHMQDTPETFLGIMRLDPKQSADVGNDFDKFVLGSPIEQASVPVDEAAWTSGPNPAVIGVGSHCVFLACSLADLPGDVGGDCTLEVNGDARRVRLTTETNALAEVSRYAQTPLAHIPPELERLRAEFERLSEEWYECDDDDESDKLYEKVEELKAQVTALEEAEAAKQPVPFCAFESRHWVLDRPVVQLRALKYGAGIDLPLEVGQRIAFTRRD